MTTNDEPLSTYRPAYVAGLERRVADQQEAIAKAVEALEAVGMIEPEYSSCDICAGYMCNISCPWCGGSECTGHKPDCPREAALAVLRRVAGLQMR